MRKKYKVILAVLGVFLFFLVIVGISYLFYHLKEDKKIVDNDIVTSGTLAIKYNPKNDLLIENMKVGDSASVEFTVENVGSEMTYYEINFSAIINEFSKKDEFVYEVLGSNGAPTKEATLVPDANSNIISNVNIEVGTKNKHSYKINFKYLKEDKKNSEQRNLELKIEVKNIETTSLLKDVIIAQNGLSDLWDNLGTSYYFTGDADVKNNVKFANYMWRIIRINGDGSIRLIYNDSLKNVSLINYSDDAETVATAKYATLNGEEITSSKIKTVLDNWYEKNILTDEKFSNKIANSYYCNDTTEEFGYFTSATKEANFNCENNDYLYSVKEQTIGNNLLKYPIGLITSDEVLLAGGTRNTETNDSYLKSEIDTWTISPESYTNLVTKMYVLSNKAQLIGTPLTDKKTFRPVISLKSTVSYISGNGSIENPFIID